MTKGGTVVKNSCANQETQEMPILPWVGKTPGGGNGNPLQCTCLENSMGKGAWWAAVHGVAKESNTTE